MIRKERTKKDEKKDKLPHHVYCKGVLYVYDQLSQISNLQYHWDCQINYSLKKKTTFLCLAINQPYDVIHGLWETTCFSLTQMV